MARHDQRPDTSKMICPKCLRGMCEYCIDVMRAVYSKSPICECKRQGHDGEPINQQILDPETGTVHAPGLDVTIDGEVIRHGK